MSTDLTATCTVDTIWSDEIRIAQPKRGYRFTVDAVLLAKFLRSDPDAEILEIGTGTGVIAILFSHLQTFRRLISIEIQKELADLARINFNTSFRGKWELFEMDAKDFSDESPAQSFDFIFSNPPYRRTGTGKLNPSQQKAIARHELKLKMEDLFQCSRKLLKEGGRLSVILPHFREKDFRELVDQHGFFWETLQYVHHFENRPPVFFLATLRNQPTAFTQLPPTRVPPHRSNVPASHLSSVSL